MNNKTIELYKKVREIIDPVYIVGGAVRDEILGNTPKDYDFTTPISVKEVEKAVKSAGKRAYLVGKRFGTIGFKIDGEMIEVTTFRHETYKENSRKPDVTYVNNLGEDLKRRDFTMNAMVYRNGKIIDFFGGKEDLENKVIRYVGNATERINDDPLRMLRCARFMSKYNLKADAEIMTKTQRRSHRILMISKERIMDEMTKLLLTENPAIGLNFLMDSGVLRFILPELALQKNYDQNSVHHTLTLWEHTLGVVCATPTTPVLRWSALLHDIGKPFVRTNQEIFSLNSVTEVPQYKSNYIKHDLLGAELVAKTAMFLKWSNELRNEVVAIVKHHLDDGNILRQYDIAGKIF